MEQCYSCHSQTAKRLRAGLFLDTREGLLKGGDSGPAVVPGNAGKSLLIKALKYEPFTTKTRRRFFGGAEAPKESETPPATP